MSALDEYLEREKNQPDLYDDEGWKLLEQARAELAALRAENARLSAAVEKARYILIAIDNSGADSQLCDISVRRPEDIHGVWICDAATAWIDANPAPAQTNS